ncbi:MAG: hypothetical protein GWO20_03020 [Candidatus Korarchaeota archaeon]|nr:hypothetical protein [Candidatus Korarchaeota archaeon]
MEGASGDRHFDETWDSFKSALRMFDEQIEMNGWFDVFGEIFSNYRWYDAETEMERWRRVWRDSMEATLADLLNPQKNKFNLIKAGDSVKPFKGNELWVGGPSLLIRHEEFDVRTNEFHKTREFLEDILE